MGLRRRSSARSTTEDEPNEPQDKKAKSEVDYNEAGQQRRYP